MVSIQLRVGSQTVLATVLSNGALVTVQSTVVVGDGKATDCFGKVVVDLLAALVVLFCK